MKIIAHRGASGSAPENTISAFKLALKYGCDGIELDVQQTLCGEIVVFHDWKLERTTNGKGSLRDKTLEELKELDCGSWFSEKFINEKIPTLDEVLEIIPENILINIEIKEEYSKERGIEKKVLEILKKRKRSNIIISSFSHNILKNIYRINKEIKLGLLIGGSLTDILMYIKMSGIKFFSYHPEKSFLRKEEVEVLSKEGIEINVWTVNDIEDAKILKLMGVTSVITNYPEKIKKLKI